MDLLAKQPPKQRRPALLQAWALLLTASTCHSQDAAGRLHSACAESAASKAAAAGGPPPQRLHLLAAEVPWQVEYAQRGARRVQRHCREDEAEWVREWSGPW